MTGDAAAGRTVVLQRRGHRGWRTIDRTMTDASGHYRLRHRPREAASARVRVRVAGTSATRSLGRLNAYRRASASWYGPGLYGNHLPAAGGCRTPSAASPTSRCRAARA